MRVESPFCRMIPILAFQIFILNFYNWPVPNAKNNTKHAPKLASSGSVVLRPFGLFTNCALKKNPVYRTVHSRTLVQTNVSVFSGNLAPQTHRFLFLNILKFRNNIQCIPMVSQSKRIIKSANTVHACVLGSMAECAVHNYFLRFLVGQLYVPALLSLEAARLVLWVMKC